MGRFRLHDDDCDDGEVSPSWEFVGDAGEEKAIVERIALEPPSASISIEPARSPQIEQTRDWEAVPCEDEFLHEPKRKSKKIFYISLLIAAIALFWKDPPPAPPSTELSWNDYLFTHTHQVVASAVALLIHTPWHVLSWFTASVRTDVQLLVERIQKQPICVPNEKLELVGQELAIEWLTDARQAWSGLERPLVVLATGTKSTGKRTLGVQLAGCNSVLELKLDTDDFHKVAVAIQSHVERVGQGAVIFMKNIEDLDSELLSKLLSSLRDDSEDTSWPNLLHACRHCIVYLTSQSIGVSEITRNLRLTGGDLFAANGLAADLKDVVVERHDLKVDVVLPFGPFRPDSLALLLRKRVTEYYDNAFKKNKKVSGIIVTNAAVAAFLDERRVEYLEWHVSAATYASAETATVQNENTRRQQHQQHLMTVAIDGANVLADNGPTMTKIYAQLNQLVRDGERTAANSKRLLVLDFDAASFRTDRGVLKWCTNEQRMDCQVARRFRI